MKATVVSWLVIACVVLWESRGLFTKPEYEQADNAANALSIDRAKHGEEIYGNYSRFTFRHPGPAFVYVYAAGEMLFEDWLGVISPRHNAHVLTGILLQAAFLALAIGIAASHSASPWRAAGLLTALALLHFSLVPGTFNQVWPPLVLIMPFTLFVVASASVMSGRTGHGAWLALSAGFLLHGHIAQFLFVGITLLAVAGTLIYRRLKGKEAPLPSRRQALVLVLIVALTIWPWLIDAFRGRESNIFDIWLHIKRRALDPLRPSWPVAIADTFSYFCYCTRQDDWFSPGASLTCLQFLRAYALGAFAAIVQFAACAYVLWGGRGSRLPRAAFQRCLAGVCALAILLCVVWARRQDGGVTFFNSLFIFGLMMAIWVIPSLSFAENATATGMALCCATLAGSLVFTASRYGELPVFMEVGALGREAASKVPIWLSKEAHPERAKLLIFSPDQWRQAVTVAAALNRAGIRSYVPESEGEIWKEMFGEDHVLKSLEDARAKGPFSWWRTAKGPGTGDRLEGGEMDGVSGHELRRLPFAFDLRRPVGSFGLSKPEDRVTWTESRVVLMRFWSEPARSDVRIGFIASPVPLFHGGSQRVRMLINGRMLPEILVTHHSDYSVTVPKSWWNSGSPTGLIDLEWGFPDSGRLEELPDSIDKDGRLLGICFHKLEFGLVDPLITGFRIHRRVARTTGIEPPIPVPH